MAGRGFGKTRIGAEQTREWTRSFEFVNIIGATADDARDIMIEGESGILAICPPWERPQYQPSRRQLAWPSGAKTLIFTADEPERLRGKQHEKIWADELAAWRYADSWDQAMFGLRLGVDPQAVITTTPKPNRLIRDLLANPGTALTRGSTYDNVDNLAAAFAEEIIRKYEGTRLGRQELDGELLLDEGLAYPTFSERIHVVAPFDLPHSWQRFESMDFGSSNPTAWYPYAVDYDGNLIVFDEYYEPGIPDVHAPEIKRRRAALWEAKDDEGWQVRNRVFADPSIRNRAPIAGRMGHQTSVEQEFNQLGIGVTPGQNDRRAGHVRIASLLRVDEKHRPPRWATHLPEDAGSPRLFVFSQCVHLIEQLKEAPLEEDGKPLAGEAIDRDWEGAHGHAHAALRYGVMSRPQASEERVKPPDDMREDAIQRLRKRLEDRECDLIEI